MFPYITSTKHKLGYIISFFIQYLLILFTVPTKLNRYRKFMLFLFVALNTTINWGKLTNMFTTITYSKIRKPSHHIPYQEVINTIVITIVTIFLLYPFKIHFSLEKDSISLLSLFCYFSHVVLGYISVFRLLCHAICEWPNKTDSSPLPKQFSFNRVSVQPKEAFSKEAIETCQIPDMHTWDKVFNMELARRLVVAKKKDDPTFKNPLKQQDVPISSSLPGSQNGDRIFQYEEDQEAMDILMARRAHFPGTPDNGINGALPNDMEMERVTLRKKLNPREEALLDAFGSLGEYLRPELIERAPFVVNGIIYNMLSIENNSLVDFIRSNFTDFMVWNKKVSADQISQEFFKIMFHMILDIVTSSLYYISRLERDTKEYSSYISALSSIMNKLNVFTRNLDNSWLMGIGIEKTINGIGREGESGSLGKNSGRTGGTSKILYPGRSLMRVSSGAIHHEGGGRGDRVERTYEEFGSPTSKLPYGSYQKFSVPLIGGESTTVDTMATINEHYSVRIEYGDIPLPLYNPPVQEPLSKGGKLGELVEDFVLRIKLLGYRTKLVFQGLMKRSFADCPIIPSLLVNMELLEPLLQGINSFVKENDLMPGDAPQYNAPLNAMVGVLLHATNILQNLAARVMEEKLVEGSMFSRTLLIDLRARRILALV